MAFINRYNSLIALVAFTGNVIAANNVTVLKEVSGNLMVNNSTKYATGVNGMTLKSNDKVIVPSNAGGKIVRDDCTYVLKPNTVVTVSETGCDFVATPYVANQVGQTKAVESNTTAYKVLGVAGVVGVVAAVSSGGGGSNKNSNASAE